MPFALYPSSLSSTVVAVEASLCQSRAFHDLPVQADARRYAGCNDGQVLVPFGAAWRSARPPDIAAARSYHRERSG
jgi:hypothetical protein